MFKIRLRLIEAFKKIELKKIAPNKKIRGYFLPKGYSIFLKRNTDEIIQNNTTKLK
ncbi:MAG: hypothetical protein RLZ16_886 [Bacteroidota bacterium]|jgi:hypothetical protein